MQRGARNHWGGWKKGKDDKEKATEEEPMMSRLRLIASDFFVSFFWVWSGSLLRCLAFRFLGPENRPGVLLIKGSLAVPYLVFFAWLGRATKGGSYNPLIVLCYALSGNFAGFLFSVLARIPAQVFGSVLGVWLTNLTFPGAFYGPSLNADIHQGTFTEGFLTFVIVVIVLSLKKKDCGSSSIRIWISSSSKVILHLLGSDITGGIMNPATLGRRIHKTSYHSTIIDSCKGEQKMKYYVIFIGRRPGVYTTWEECHSNVVMYSGALYRKVNSEEEAYALLQAYLG